MSTSVSEFMQPYLQPGEELLYSGRPFRGFVWAWYDYVYLGLSLLFLLFAGLLFVLFPKQAIAFLWPCFVPMAIYPLLRYLLGIRRRQHIFYGISRQRVIIVAHFPAKEQRILAFADMSAAVFKPYRKGYGSIRFMPLQVSQPAVLYELEVIPDAEQVYKLVQEQLRR